MKKQYRGVIFDLDGVIVSTDDCHYRAWKRLADEEGIYFDRKINDRLRGVSRMDSLEIILEKAEKEYEAAEKERLAQRKNGYYKEYIQELEPSAVLNGAIEFVTEVRKLGLKTAVGSSSKNALPILEQIQCMGFFDAVADGNDIQRSKPAPDVFLKAAEKLGLLPEDCLVVEDADAGVAAAQNAGMDVIGVGAASGNMHATYRAKGLYEERLMEIFEE